MTPRACFDVRPRLTDAIVRRVSSDFDALDEETHNPLAGVVRRAAVYNSHRKSETDKARHL